MKKIMAAFAAGVLAFGGSARATDVESAEYAVITIPIVAGNNLIGISVEASDLDLTAVLKGLDGFGEAVVKTWGGSAYTTTSVASKDVSKGDSFFLVIPDGTASFNAYEIGVAPSEASAASTTVANMSIVAPPFASSWTPGRLTFSTDGSSRIGTANKIHVWNASLNQYDTYWYKASGDAKAGWYKKGNSTKLSSLPNFGPGQSVFVEFGNGTSSKPASGTVEFAAP